MKKTALHSVILLMTIIYLTGCVVGYKPQTEWEQREFKNADFNIYPDNVRSDLAKYKNTEVAWAGIIEESEFYEQENTYQVLLLMEHHYFDWKVDKMGSPQLYYPSAEGEGMFQTTWYLKKDADLDYFIDRFGAGNLAIVYAKPDTVIDDVVLVNADYIRIIDKEHFLTDQIYYIPKEALRNRYDW